MPRSGWASSAPSRYHPGGDLERARSGRCQGALHGRAVRHGRAGQVRRAVRRRAWPGRGWTRAAADRPGRRRVRGGLHRGAAGRGGGRPAGRAVARRRLRGRSGGALVRRDAARAGGRVPAARAWPRRHGRCCRPRRDLRRPPAPGAGVHHARRRDGQCSPRLPAKASGADDPDRRDGPGTAPDRARLAAHVGSAARAGACRCRCGDHRRSGPARGPAARGGGGRVGRGHGARPRSATRAWRSSLSPTRGPRFRPAAAPAGAATWCPPWTGGRSRPSPSPGQVAAPGRRGRTARLVVAMLGRPHRRGGPAAARRRGAGRAGGGGTRRCDRGARGRRPPPG